MKIEAKRITQDDVSSNEYLALVRAVSYVKTHYANEVSGIWLITRKTIEGASQIVVRTTLKRGSVDYVLLCGNLSSILGGCVTYDYDELDSDSYGAKEEIESGNVLLLYLNKKGE